MHPSISPFFSKGLPSGKIPNYFVVFSMEIAARPHRSDFILRPFGNLKLSALLIFLLGMNPLVNAQEKLFREVPQTQSGITFRNTLPDDQCRNVFLSEYYYNGGGVAIGDLNQDNLPDIYFVSNHEDDQIYLNRGNMRFEDVSEAAGITGFKGWPQGVSMADVNADGLLDLYICRNVTFEPENAAANLLFINLGPDKKGIPKFRESAEAFGIADTSWSVDAAWLDYDRDGDLDLYLLNRPMNTPGGMLGALCPSARENLKKQPGKTDRLYRNDGKEGFKDVTKEAGIENFGFGLSVTVGDLDGDSWPDIYVANDYFERDFLYFNNGDGTFSESIRSATGHISTFSMGSDIGDFNNDGLQDIIVVDMAAETHRKSKENMSGMNPERFWQVVEKGEHYQYMHNALQLNAGNRKFQEISHYSGVAQTDWSWAAFFADFDQDTRKDLLVANGIRREIRHNDARKRLKEKVANLPADYPLDDPSPFLEEYPSDRPENYIYKNEDGLKFSKKTSEWGLDFKGWTQGVAWGDLDRDGDLDLVLNNQEDPAVVYENLAESNPETGNYLIIQPGKDAPMMGWGLKVRIPLGEEVLMNELFPSRGFLSSMEPMLHIGAGEYDEFPRVELTWPDGRVEVLRNVKCNQHLVVNPPSKGNDKNQQDQPEPLFQLAGSLSFSHVENEYDDYEKQVLLPHKLSEEGPFMAAADINNDGLDDLFFGGTAESGGRILIQTQGNEFISQEWRSQPAPVDDGGATWLDVEGDGDLDLLVARSGNEAPDQDPAYQPVLFINDGKGGLETYAGKLPAFHYPSNCVISADIDQDGDTDIFIGGRHVPGKFPSAPASALWINEGGVFVDQTEKWNDQFSHLGMVTAGIWMDWDEDGKKDLIVAGEWMGIRLFRNLGNEFEEVTHAAGLEGTNGLWVSLFSGDLDGDGDMDLIAGNMGLNSKFHADPTHPFEVYFNDMDENGILDIVLAKNKAGTVLPVRGRQCSSEQVPFVAERMKTYEEFAKSDIFSIYGEERIQKSERLQVFELANAVFWNEEGKFKKEPLPAQAQFSPVNATGLTDLNDDGYPDLILAGNAYGQEVETTRQDAGLGTVLINRGDQTWKPIRPDEAGFFAEGDVRGMVQPAAGKSKIFLLARNGDEPLILRKIKE